jgi:hypothetical protein
MKKIVTTLLIISFGTLLAIAQENDLSIDQDSQPVQLDEGNSETITNQENNSEEKGNIYFDLQLEKVKQNPFSKKILYKLYITPKIDSPKTQIIWTTPLSFSVDSKHEEFVSLKKDSLYTFEAIIKPQKSGDFNVTATVISWQHDTNKSNSVDSNLSLSKSLVAQPRDSQYTITLILYILGILLLIVGIIFGITKGVQLLIKKAKVWITPPF